MIHIAICDDNLQICNELEQYINELKENRKIEVDKFRSGKAFEEELKEKYYDIIFLDVIMGDLSGIDLGRKIREEMRNDTSLIIYMSGYSEYALDLFQFQPFHFLKKPIDQTLFQKVFYQACDRVEHNTGMFEFKSGRMIRRLPLNQILYFEGDNRRVKIVTNRNVYYCYSTIEKLFSKINMEQAGFIRIHKSYAVNTAYISGLTTRLVRMTDGVEFTVSAQFKENAQRRYEAYVKRLEG